MPASPGHSLAEQRDLPRLPRNAKGFSAGAISAIAAVALWFFLVACLPWGMGDWLAALPLAGGNGWQAGQDLKQAADPVSFDRIVKLSQACGNQAVELCTAALAVKAAEGVVRKGAVPARSRLEAPP